MTQKKNKQIINLRGIFVRRFLFFSIMKEINKKKKIKLQINNRVFIANIYILNQYVPGG